MENKFYITSEGLYYDSEFVSSFIPVLEEIQDREYVDGRKSETKYMVSVKLSESRQLEKKELDSIINIPYFKLWKECCDAELTGKQRNRLALYLQYQAQTVPVKNIFYLNKMGYNESVYVFDRNNVIDFDYERNYDFVTDKSLPEFCVSSYTRQEYIKHFADMAEIKRGVSEVLMLSNLYGILKPLFNEAGYHTSAFVIVYGDSGVGKTMLSKLFFVHNHLQEKNFKTDNKRTIESSLDEFAGHTVLIDDYHPESLQYGKNRQDSILDFIARKSENGNSALAVITAEYLGGCFSVQDRSIQIKVPDRIANFEKFYTLESKKNLYVSALYDFAKKIYQNKENVISRMKNYSLPIDRDKTTYRIAYNIELMKICLSIFYSDYLEEEERKIFDDKYGGQNFSDYVKELLAGVKNAQIKNMDRIRMGKEDIDWVLVLYKMLNKDDIFVICPELDSLDKSEYEGLAVMDTGKKIYIRSLTLRKGLCKYFGYKINPKPMIDSLIREHILDEDRSLSHMKKKKDGHYYYEIDEIALNYYWKFTAE